MIAQISPSMSVHDCSVLGQKSGKFRNASVPEVRAPAMTKRKSTDFCKLRWKRDCIFNCFLLVLLRCSSSSCCFLPYFLLLNQYRPLVSKSSIFQYDYLILRNIISHPGLTLLIGRKSRVRSGQDGTRDMGTGLGRAEVVEVQEQLHVEYRVPSSKNEVHRLPAGSDILCRVGVARNRCLVW